MDVKPGYKQTETGVIPEEWENRTLESVCVPGGLIRGPFGGTLKKEFFVGDGFKVYEQRNAIYRDADLGSYFIDKMKYSELSRFQVQAGDFIVSCSGTIGRIFQIPEFARAGVINQALLIIRVDRRFVDDKYFFFVFDWDRFQDKILDNTHGGAMQNLVGMDVFRNVTIAVPTLAEQQAIAEALSDVDALISALDQLIAKKRAIKQGAMQELLTGRRRLPGFDGEWEVRHLGSILQLRYGKSQRGITVNDGRYPILATSGIVGRTNRSLYDKPSVIIGRKGTIDAPLFVDTPFWAIDTTYYSEISELAHPEYLYYLFTTFDWYAYNEASGVPSLSARTVHGIEASLPSVLEQQAIAAVLSDMDSEIAALERRRDKTKLLKQGMMQELLTGKTRLL